MSRLSIALVAASLPCLCFGQGFDFADFNGNSGLNLVAGAETFDKKLRLTRSEPDRTGAVWFSQKLPLAGGFESRFQFQFTDQAGLGPGADGLAFVLQSASPEAIAGKGSSGGFALGDGLGKRNRPGIPNSIALFFDTFYNPDGRDPSSNYLALCTNGRPGKMRWPPPRIAVAENLPFDMKDGKIHAVRVLYRPPVLSVFLDEAAESVLEVGVDLGTVLDREGKAYAGFTASTGAGFQNHDLLSWSLQTSVISSAMVSSEISFSLTQCLPDRKLCTPREAMVNEIGDGHYRVILPAHLPWGASVPNPTGRPPKVEDARGIVCWDLEGQGQDGCGGPSGRGLGGEGALLPGESLGALVAQSRDKRTYFSVNGDRKKGFGKHEGFFEFDVLVEH